jgi:hypothetical protein
MPRTKRDLPDRPILTPAQLRASAAAAIELSELSELTDTPALAAELLAVAREDLAHAEALERRAKK